MEKRTLHQRVSGFMVVAAVLVLIAVSQGFCQNIPSTEPDRHNQRGIELFKQGFYDHAPRGRVVDADRSYGLAVQEFKAAITGDPSHPGAHKNLARVYYVQKNFQGAAEEYQSVTELMPGDLDAYVNWSLSLIELKRLDEAIDALQIAKRATADPKALDALDRYIEKIRMHREKEVR